MDGTRLILIILILFVLFLLIDLKRKKDGEKYAAQLAEALQKQDYDTFDRLVQSSAVLRSVSGYNLSMMQFNEAVMKDESEKASGIFDALMQTRMNEQQLASLLVNAAGFFAVKHDQKRLKQIQKKADVLKNDKIQNMVNQAVQASSTYPDLTLEQLTSILQNQTN